LERQLAQSTSAASIFISETKLVANASTISWEDELSFPMLEKNGGERNVLCLNHLEAENVPDLTAFSDEGDSQLYLKLSVPPTGSGTTGQDGAYLHLQLLSHERRSPDKLIAQGLIQVRGPGGDLVGDKKGRILLHFNCVVKGLADYVLFRCQYEWRTSTSNIDQPALLDFGMPADLSYEIRQQLRIKHLVFEARQRYELIFEHMDSQIRKILGDTSPAVSVELYRHHTIRVLQAIDFDKGKAILSAASRHILDQVARAIKEVHKLSLFHGITPLIVSVEGHTNCKDPMKQSSPYHMGLSMERALKCREYLESAGVERKYLQSQGFGGTTPISETRPEANQRTEFNVLDNFEEEIQRAIAAELAQS